MSATQLPLAPHVHYNQQLFSDYFLDHLVQQYPDWDALVAEAAGVLPNIKALFDAYTPSNNEAQLENDLIRPIFAQLGHDFLVQVPLRTPDGTKKPDYIVFNDAGTANSLRNQPLDDQLLAGKAVAIADAKAWDRPLDQAIKVGSDPFSNKNPSYQIAFYIQHSGLDWGILTNGRIWRLYQRDSAHKLDRFYAVNLPELLNDPQRFVYFYAFFRRAAFDQLAPIHLNALLKASREYARGVSESIKEQVYAALRHVAQGFFDVPTNQLDAQQTADLRRVYDASLLVLYRLLFILYAEARDLLPIRTNATYAQHYSLNAIKQEIAQQHDRGVQLLNDSTNYWARLRDIFRFIDKGRPPLGIATFNGGLFDPTEHPFLEQATVGDEHLMAAIDLLTRVDRQFIDYRDLAERHLGTIYEGLLEFQLEPLAQPDASFSIDLLNDKGERKASGSYYTPDYIVQYMIEQTIKPAALAAIANAQSDEAKISAILQLNILDPAMGSGHFLVSATEYLAQFLVDLGIQPDEQSNGEADVAFWRRRVAQSCIYGVDLNPLAVDLAKLSLWLITVAKDKPLSFLDHHLRVGNALVGATLDNLRPRVRRTRQQTNSNQTSMLDDNDMRRSLGIAVDSMFLIEGNAAESVADVKEQERVYQQLRRDLSDKYGKLANLATAQYFGLELDANLWDTLADVALGRRNDVPSSISDTVQHAQTIAAERWFFHWELEFPEIFFDRFGASLGDQAGFDVVLGNPPYGILGDQYNINFLVEQYSSISNRNIFTAFFQLATEKLKNGERMSFITPSSWQTGNGYIDLRNFIFSNLCPIKVIELPFNTFAEAYVDAGIYVFSKTPIVDDTKADTFAFPKSSIQNVSLKNLPYKGLLVNQWKNDSKKRIILDQDSMSLFEKLSNNLFIYLKDITKSTRGILYSESDLSISKKDNNHFSFFDGSINRYSIEWDLSKFVLYGNNLREKPASTEYFTNPRLLIRRIVSRQDRIMSIYEDRSFVSTKDIYNFLPTDEDYNLLYLLSLVNSKLISYLYLSQDTIATKDDFRQVTLTGIRNLPIRRINFVTAEAERARLSGELWQLYNDKHPEELLHRIAHLLDPSDEHSDVVHDILAKLAQRMLELHKQRSQQRENLMLDLEGILQASEIAKIQRLWTPSKTSNTEAERELGALAQRKLDLHDDFALLNEQQWKWLLKHRLKTVSNLSGLVQIYRQHQPNLATLEGEIERTDRLIDQIVYRLYGLNAEDIAVIEDRR